jgi:transposase
LPDLNPIEAMWSKVKHHLRALAARIRKALVQAIGAALRSVPSANCYGFFKGYGYTTTQKQRLL